MTTQVSPSFLKQEAKKLKKSQGLSMSKALDQKAKEYGYSNYKHYLNASEESRKKSASNKENFLKGISIQKNEDRKVDLVASFYEKFKPSFQEFLEVISSLKKSELIQSTCTKLNLMKDEIQADLFQDWVDGDGSCELDEYFRAKELTVSNLEYSIEGDKLLVDGDYSLITEFGLEIDRNDPAVKNDPYKRFDDREITGCFDLIIDKNKAITVENQDMSLNF